MNPRPGSEGETVDISTTTSDNPSTAADRGQSSMPTDGHLAEGVENSPDYVNTPESRNTSSIYPERYEPPAFGQNDSVYEQIRN